MKDFETITEYEILIMAWEELMNRYVKKEEKNNQFKIEYGRTNEIYEYQLKKLNEKIKEIEKRIIEIETEQNK
mgnify:CR=1 FL=1